MKTFSQIREETRDQKLARLRSDAAAFGKEVDAKIAARPPEPSRGTQVTGGKGVTAFAGGQYGRQAAKSNQPISSPPKAEPVKDKRPFPDKASEKSFGQDTKMKLLRLNRRIDSDTAKVNKPEPKIGSLVNKQSGYPAARPKPTVAAKPDAPQKGYPAAKQPAPPKPTLRPEREQSFGQAFAAAKKRGDKEFSWKGGKYNTKTK